MRLDVRQKEVATAQLEFALKIRDDVNHLTDAVEQCVRCASSCSAREKLLRRRAKSKELVEASKALRQKLDALEEYSTIPKAEVAYDILARKGGASCTRSWPGCSS